MATLRELIIKISANSQSFQSEIQRASRMGSEYYRTLQNGGRQAAAAAREQRRALAELHSQLTEIRASAVGMTGAFAGAFATGHLISLADEWSSVNARLKQASQSSDEFASSQKVLMDISQRTGTAFSDNAALFARSAASMREYGYSADDVLKVTEAISTGLKISGASTAEAGSVITQFSQALAQGVLRGEEFNSVNESGDRIVRALAAGMGVARKDLKAMADDGKLTADKVVPALISQLGILRDEYAAMPETVSSSITKVENAFMAWVGGANEASGVTKTLSGMLNGVAGQIDNVATAVGALVAVGVARYFGNMASGAMSATAGLVTAARNEVALAEAQFRGNADCHGAGKGSRVPCSAGRGGSPRDGDADCCRGPSGGHTGTPEQKYCCQKRRPECAEQYNGGGLTSDERCAGAGWWRTRTGDAGGCSMVHAVPESGAGQGVCAPVCTDDR